MLQNVTVTEQSIQTLEEEVKIHMQVSLQTSSLSQQTGCARIYHMLLTRQPNVVVFIGMMAHPNLGIVTEFVERGSLVQCLQNGEIETEKMKYLLLPWSLTAKGFRFSKELPLAFFTFTNSRLSTGNSFLLLTE